MSKRMKVIVAVVAAIVVMAVGGTTVALAQEEPVPPPEIEENGLIPRVAEILGISEEELADAFKQARQETREEAFYKFLDKAVEEERITEGEATEIKEWWEQKPEVCDRLMLRARIRNAIRNRQMLQQGAEAANHPMLGARIRQATHERQMQQQGILPMQGGPATPSWLAE